MWRCDAERSARSPQALPEQLQLQWTKTWTPRVPAWDDPLNLDLMTYDRVFEPIVVNGHVIVPFNDTCKIVALDAKSGNLRWTFFTEAPVRLAPVGFRDSVLLTSDDGCLYCVAIIDGSLLWKFNAAPSRQQAIGNRRLVSAWPSRGGPVVRDDTVYFASSVWPFMGTFIYALDAATGNVQWVNDSTGSQFIKQPHSAPSFAGVAPQGALVATRDKLVVPGGRSVPAVFDRATGKLDYFELNAGGKGTGGSFVAATDERFYVHTRDKGTRAFNLETGLKTAFMPNEPVLYNGHVYTAEEDHVRCYDGSDKLVWEVAADGTGDLILCGDELVAAGKDSITFIRLPHNDSPAAVSRTIAVKARIERLLAADDKLFAVTLDGELMTWGVGTPATSAVAAQSPTRPIIDDGLAKLAAELLGADAGYSFFYGGADSPLALALALQSRCEQLAIVDDDESAIGKLRKELDALGLHGRVTVHNSSLIAPQYVAEDVIIDAEAQSSISDASLARIYQSVRPYGGKMHLLCDDDPTALASHITSLDLEQAEVQVRKGAVTVIRVGQLPGAADWTHQYGDISNTVKSDDRRVKLPLGVLWFGGNSNTDVLPRHGHGPPEQVIGGRLFIQGINQLSSRDVYTGRILWQRRFKDLGTFDVYFDETYEDTPLDPKYNQVHIPGANGRGTNYVATEDRIYLLEGSLCHVLDPATGETLAEIRMPKSADGETESWAYIGVYKDVLIGGAGFADYGRRHQLQFESDKEMTGNKAGFASKSLDRAASQSLIGFDRHSGKQLWQVNANHSFWHNGVIAGDDKLFCLDKQPQFVSDALARRGRASNIGHRIVAFDYRTGKEQWQITDNVFGTWLGYSAKHDALLQATSKASDRLAIESSYGMAVYSGKDGALRWKNDELQYTGPCILHNDLIITGTNSNAESAGAYSIVSGQPKLITNPLTGVEQPWRITRAYGCNSIIASENLLTFRSGAAAFYDLLTESGTGNLGGFKSGCTSNLVVADGVLNAPDYTRTCSCAYQNQTSLALVHMPDVDMWSVNSMVASDEAAYATTGQQIQSLAINFSAPGDRRDSRQVLWLEYPSVGGPSPEFSIRTNPEAKPFQHHSSAVESTDLPWVLASGFEGITDLQIDMRIEGKEKSVSKVEPRRYDIRLHFGIPKPLGSGPRQFNVSINGDQATDDISLDPSGKTAHVSAVMEARNVLVDETLHIKFVPRVGEPVISGIDIRQVEVTQ